MAAPDLAGFADAQERLRDHFGEVVVFLFPLERTYPPGTRIDPETQMPWDPTIEPSGTAQASASASCTVATRPFGKDDVEESALAGVERDHIMLAGDLELSSLASGAVDFEVRGDRYKVTSMRPDGIGGVQRWLTFGRKR